MTSLVTAYRNQKEFEKALPLSEEYLKVRKDRLGDNHPDTWSSTQQSMHNLAVWHYNHGSNIKALSLFEERLRVQRDTLGENHPNTLHSLDNLAILYSNQREYGISIVDVDVDVGVSSTSLANGDFFKLISVWNN
eukprot:gene10969-11957_t